ncbi:TauD/TfdA family dioxygenase [Achromobacter sp. GG226]|uniref:TauD/TfdA dioxygenase family protein n=1 Tax=Verticiella alkaliphila TaxID=2779529 RepID=UPI001C0D88C7|nr:TauD/TfdA family dioxygenase [Verticiella sp. GG226]MBU4611596.1 TauD/TfdA family dioxygenase [Verticiella sp. GG226]
MSLQFTPLHRHFCAEVTGLDLTCPSAELAAEIDRAMADHAVLVVRGQPLTQDEQMAFTRSFGALDLGFKKVSNAHTRLKYQELADISNVAEDGSIAQRSHRRIVNNVANQIWHSDSSFQNPPARYSMLHAVVIPPKGGATQFADMRAAYDALDADTQAEIEDLLVEHFVLHSRFMLGDTEYSEDKVAAMPRVLWPLVRTHDDSGRRHLFIGAHASRIDGMSLPEGRLLLSDLLEHATQPQFVYEHTWEPGDLVIWDNRCTLHRGRRYDFSQRRELRRSTTLDRTYPTPERAAA